VERIRQATGNPQVEGLLADWSVPADVMRLAGEAQARYPHVDVLVNNAGALFSQRTLSDDGIEMTWVLNHLDFDHLQGQQRDGGWRAYAQSKLANVLFTYELAMRLDGTGVTTNALHPGFVATHVGRNRRLTTVLFRAVQRVAALRPEEGAEAVIYLERVMHFASSARRSVCA